MGDLQRTLLDLHHKLGEAHRLDPEERAMLEAAVEDIRQALAKDAVVADSPPVPPGDALEGAAVRLEAEHPSLATAVRAVVDALGKAGI
jgi:Domain of unknown function (DUF4404)